MSDSSKSKQGDQSGLRFKTLRKFNVDRNTNAGFSNCHKTWTLSDWMTALTGEVGEAANIIKKMKRGDFDEHAGEAYKARIALGKELADIQAYLDLLAWAAGINLEQVTIDKFNEVSARPTVNYSKTLTNN